MASPQQMSSPSPWAPSSHGVDMNGYAVSPVGSVEGKSFESSTQTRSRRGSSPGRRALQWFTRSRSASPQMEEQPPSPSSFVVRNVIKQPGGVSHEQQKAANEYYQRQQSRPISTTLGVPAGGPGGGIGYGTAKSSNDGRPEHDGPQQPLVRGRSKSPSRPASPGAITAGAFRSGRVSPGPMSWSQAKTLEDHRKRDTSTDRASSQRSPMQSVSSFLSGPRNGSPSPQRGGFSPQPTSPLAGSVLAPTVSAVSVSANERQAGFSMPVQLPPHSSGYPPVIPLEGLPSPINVLSSPAQAGATPLGSVSPAGSPGHFMGGTGQNYEGRGSPGSPSMASRWMKGLFGKSPRSEERVNGYAPRDSRSPSPWMQREGSPLMSAQNSSKYLHNSWSDGTPLPGVRARDETEAEERKRQSMHMAMRIEDHHRDQVIRTGNSSENLRRPWNPRQSTQDGYDSALRCISPPGRKPVPHFSAEELQNMTLQEREEVASHVDPNGQLSKLQGPLTPAQQIIAETRSRQLEKKRAEGRATHVQRGFEPGARRGSEETSARAPDVPSKSPETSIRRHVADEETPVRRTSKKQSPTKAAAVNNDATPQPKRLSTMPSPRPNGSVGLNPGDGPLPNEMPLLDALQEMMVRFYRFERYAVPLMRSLEARIVDVERDNQMALHNDAMSANSARDREMDRWVGQMTSLMKHEIGQLKAATKEIRGGRELLAKVAKATQMGNSTAEAQREVLPQSNAARGEASSTNEERDAVRELRPSEPEVDHNRNSNFSSSTFKSAVPRKMTLDVPTHEASLERTASGSSSSPTRRPRYTNALGQPMMGGKLSPAASPVRECAPPLARSPSPISRSSSQHRSSTLNDRLRALVNDKMRSSSSASNSTRASSQSVSVQEADEEESGDNTSFEKIGHDEKSGSGDDYQIVMARGPSEASARSLRSSDEGEHATRHLQAPSSASHAVSTATVTQGGKIAQHTANGGGGVSFPSSPTSSSRPRSVSPGNLTSNITLPSHATNGLRARAQSYLLNAESSSCHSSVPSSPVPSPRFNSDVAANSSSSLEMLPQTQPLRLQKSANPMTTSSVLQERRSNSELLGSNMPTLKSSSSANSSHGTPVRQSIRDRVAFFDAPK